MNILRELVPELYSLMEANLHLDTGSYNLVLEEVGELVLDIFGIHY